MFCKNIIGGLEYKPLKYYLAQQLLEYFCYNSVF